MTSSGGLCTYSYSVLLPNVNYPATNPRITNPARNVCQPRTSLYREPPQLRFLRQKPARRDVNRKRCRTSAKPCKSTQSCCRETCRTVPGTRPAHGGGVPGPSPPTVRTRSLAECLASAPPNRRHGKAPAPSRRGAPAEEIAHACATRNPPGARGTPATISTRATTRSPRRIPGAIVRIRRIPTGPAMAPARPPRRRAWWSEGPLVCWGGEIGGHRWAFLLVRRERAPAFCICRAGSARGCPPPPPPPPGSGRPPPPLPCGRPPPPPLPPRWESLPPWVSRLRGKRPGAGGASGVALKG